VDAKVDEKIAELDDAFAELEETMDDKIAEAGKPLSSNASDWAMIEKYGEYAPDAKTVGEEFAKVSDSLKTVKTYVDEVGKLHFVDSEGADSVLPFKCGISECEEIWNGAANSTYTFTETYKSVLIKSTNYSNCFPIITFNNKTPILDISLANVAIMIFADVKKGDAVTIGGDAQFPGEYAIYELK
jgi:hypothetical protein